MHSLAPGGLYILNCGDGPSLDGARAEVAALFEVFEQVCLVADAAMLKGRRRAILLLPHRTVRCRRQAQLRRRLSHERSWVVVCRRSTGIRHKPGSLPACSFY